MRDYGGWGLLRDDWNCMRDQLVDREPRREEPRSQPLRYWSWHRWHRWYRWPCYWHINIDFVDIHIVEVLRPEFREGLITSLLHFFRMPCLWTCATRTVPQRALPLEVSHHVGRSETSFEHTLVLVFWDGCPGCYKDPVSETSLSRCTGDLPD
jgi:hypothetical protein